MILYNIFTDKPATNEPGEEQNYSNTNTLISELIIDVTSQTVETVLNDMMRYTPRSNMIILLNFH